MGHWAGDPECKKNDRNKTGSHHKSFSSSSGSHFGSRSSQATGFVAIRGQSAEQMDYIVDEIPIADSEEEDIALVKLT